ncbi:O-antigen/teichoic acid export membrane protein [Lewinella aquimaris]|uniref:O-antigen/teichoic acid export membrane protein n=1 Tax=Neolewinella aquimaris TaxID=1835722 RepID=A0A840E605_9BACT|nr:oligosaccharide flippase family protein [Neolewinella aquimaris]MBB4080490.1 O-antigen/teichoic acid export membrane protein [Neolewinella aquimaris]
MKFTPTSWIQGLLNHKVVRNFSYLAVGNAVAQVISFFTVLKVTSLLAPNDYGLFTFLSAQGMLLITVGDLGIRNIIIRSIARDGDRTNDLMFNGVILRTLSLVVLSLLYLVYNFYFGTLGGWQLFLVFAFSFVNVFSNLFENAFLGHEKMLPPSILSIAHSVLWFIAVFTIPAEYIDPDRLFLLFLCLHLGKAVFLYYFLVRYNLLKGQIHNFWVSSRALLTESWPYFLLLLVMLPFTRLSNNFLDINSTNEEVGYFNLAQRLIGPVSLVLDFALAAVFPNLSSLWVSDRGRLKSLVSNSFQFFMLAGLFMCFSFSLFIREVVDLLFPASYLPAVVVCQMQIWYLFLTSIDSGVGTILGATDNERYILQLGIVNSLCATPLLFYGSKFGAVGLAYAYVVAFAVFQFYLWYVFRTKLAIRVKGAGWVWGLATVLFAVTTAADRFVTEQVWLAKGAIWFIVSGGIGWYTLRTYKTALR